MIKVIQDRSLRGNYKEPSLDLPGVRVSICAVAEHHWVWTAQACGYITQADTLPNALRALAEVFEVTDEFHQKDGRSPAWWNWFNSVTEKNIIKSGNLKLGHPAPGMMQISINRALFETDIQSMTGIEIRNLLKDPELDRDLFETVPGNHDNKIQDNNKVKIRNGQRFYTASRIINN